MADPETTVAGRGPGESEVGRVAIAIILVLQITMAFLIMWQLGAELESATMVARERADSVSAIMARAASPPVARAAEPVLARDSLQTVQSTVPGGPAPNSPRQGAVDSATGGGLLGPLPRRSQDLALFVIVLLSGALGGLLHSLRSFVWYVGNRDLLWSWIPRYLALPVEGALLSAVMYLLIRAGFVGLQGTTDVSPYGFAGAGALIGLFSQPAVLKLKQVAETLFTSPPKGADARPQGEGESAGQPEGSNAAAPAVDASSPVITLIDQPDHAAPTPVITSARVETKGGASVLLLTGAGFREQSILTVADVVTPFELRSSREMSASLSQPPTDATPVQLGVTTPPPGGGSCSFILTIAAVTPGGRHG
ncbi:MAG: hypothetical protein ABIZ91_17705 [Gemmatimonadaceae bacterium]